MIFVFLYVYIKERKTNEVATREVREPRLPMKGQPEGGRDASVTPSLLAIRRGTLLTKRLFADSPDFTQCLIF